MSRFFGHTPYAEDQPLSKTILYYHVIHRGFQTGAVFGSLSGTVRAVLARRRAVGVVDKPQLYPTLARITGRGAIIGAGVLGVGATMGRMWGREEIEWQDRSWRLLENKWQVECDDWSLVGTGAGLAAAIVKEGSATTSGRALRVIGGAGLGNLAGVVGYMIWRHGVNGGTFD